MKISMNIQNKSPFWFFTLFSSFKLWSLCLIIFRLYYSLRVWEPTCKAGFNWYNNVINNSIHLWQKSGRSSGTTSTLLFTILSCKILLSCVQNWVVVVVGLALSWSYVIISVWHLSFLNITLFNKTIIILMKWIELNDPWTNIFATLHNHVMCIEFSLHVQVKTLNPYHGWGVGGTLSFRQTKFINLFAYFLFGKLGTRVVHHNDFQI